MKDIAIYGAGSYGNEVACLIKVINAKGVEWNLIGFFDDTKPIGEQTTYGSVLGGINELNNWGTELSLIIAIGNPVSLIDIVSKIGNSKVNFPNLISPDVIFHDRETVKLGNGNVIFFRSIISYKVRLGDFNLLNNDVFIGHDSVIGSYNVLNPSTRISGNIEMGNNNFLGVCSIVLQNVKMGSNTKIGAGSCVYRNTKDNNLYIGNPAMLKLTPGSKE
jgi:sugar O-acyltransferase (sialic acid O-acetyltransferase NeuD family)